MAYKLLAAAQERWRRVNGHELVADVLDDVKFKDGIRITEDDTNHDEMTDEKVAAERLHAMSSTTFDSSSKGFAVPCRRSGMQREPPGADPHAGWCGRGRGELGSYPML